MLYTYTFVYAWVAILLAILYTSVSWEAVFPIHMVNIVLLAILPIIYALIGYIRDTPDDVRQLREYQYTLWLVSTLLSLVVIVSVWADTLTLISLILTVQILVRGMDARYLFTLALGYIVSVPLLLIMQQSWYAEHMSIQTYYALVLWTVGLMIWDRVQRIVMHYVPPLSEPAWWDEYRQEIITYLLFARRYLPIVFVILVSIVASPWRDILSYDERFVATITAIIWLLGLMRDTRREWYLPYILIAIAGASYFALFSEALIEWALGLMFYVSTLFLMYHYRSRITRYQNSISSYLSHE
jgi:hypothetical protein